MNSKLVDSREKAQKAQKGYLMWHKLRQGAAIGVHRPVSAARLNLDSPSVFIRVHLWFQIFV